MVPRVQNYGRLAMASLSLTASRRADRIKLRDGRGYSPGRGGIAL